jgi:hypothetical protein
MVQSVFDRGRLVASHANLRVRLGASGGASHKRCIDHDEIRAHLVTLGADLGWHGALSADVILEARARRYRHQPTHRGADERGAPSIWSLLCSRCLS